MPELAPMTDALDVLGRVAGSLTLFLFWCPGCECAHYLETKPDAWAWNGNMRKPTATPSILLRPQHASNDNCCHLFMRDGELQFLSDCTHGLAGKTVGMVAWEEAGR